MTRVNNWKANQFLCDMQAIDADIVDLEEAITFAISNVPAVENDELRWFGTVGGGVFYADTHRFLWYPETTTADALASMALDFGESLTSGL